VVGWPTDVPEKMQAAIKLPEDYDRMATDYDQFKAYLLRHHAA